MHGVVIQVSLKNIDRYDWFDDSNVIYELMHREEYADYARLITYEDERKSIALSLGDAVGLTVDEGGTYVTGEADTVAKLDAKLVEICNQELNSFLKTVTAGDPDLKLIRGCYERLSFGLQSALRYNDSVWVYLVEDGDVVCLADFIRYCCCDSSRVYYIQNAYDYHC